VPARTGGGPRAAGRPSLVIYVTAGIRPDWDRPARLAINESVAERGRDRGLAVLGTPKCFDGPVIQEASAPRISPRARNTTAISLAEAPLPPGPAPGRRERCRCR